MTKKEMIKKYEKQLEYIKGMMKETQDRDQRRWHFYVGKKMVTEDILEDLKK